MVRAGTAPDLRQRLGLRRHVLAEDGHDRLAVDPQGLLLVVVLEVDGELVGADRLQLLQLGDVLLRRAWRLFWAAALLVPLMLVATPRRRFDAAVKAAGQTADFEAQKENYGQAIRLQSEQDGILLPGYAPRLHAKAKNLQGVWPNFVSFFDFTDAAVE